MSENYKSMYLELNHVLLEAVSSHQEVVLCDMPDLLLRMKIAATYSLQELETIFNEILNKVVRGEGPIVSDAAAYYHFPEVFCAPRDEYMAALLHEIAQEEGVEQINCYIGNVHVKPISRLCNTNA